MAFRSGPKCASACMPRTRRESKPRWWPGTESRQPKFESPKSKRQRSESPEAKAQMTSRDRELGMDRAITRRDFLNGVAIGLGSMACHVNAEQLRVATTSVRTEYSPRPRRKLPAPPRKACAEARLVLSRSPTRCAMEPSGKLPTRARAGRLPECSIAKRVGGFERTSRTSAMPCAAGRITFGCSGAMFSSNGFCPTQLSA